MTEIHPLLDAEKQSRARQYEKEKRLLGLGNSFLSLVVLFGFYFSGLSTGLARPGEKSSIVGVFLLYSTVFFFLMFVSSLPLRFTSGYVHEHKWRFSNQTVKAWFLEQLKSALVGWILMCFMLALLFWIMSAFPKIWWLIAGLAMAVVSVFFATIFPVVVFPLFNKYTAIEDEALKRALSGILEKGGLKSSGFFKEDMSKQTKKENAFLAGLGKIRRVVLADNLMDNMNTPEIESIIAHEVGHYRHRHIWKHIGVGTVQQLLVFIVLDAVLRSFSPHFLESANWNFALLPVFAIAMGILSTLITGPSENAFSRYFETQADRYALENTENAGDFISALAGLANRNLADAYPVWWAKILYYSHPPIGERLQTAEDYRRDLPAA